MEKIHEYTKQTMDLVGQVVRETPSIPTVEEMKLRLALEFEELFEKAEAMGLMRSFECLIELSFNRKKQLALQANDHEIIDVEFTGTYFRDTNIVNLVEVFDAALDQRVVAAGTDLAFGFQDIIEAGDEEVYRSN